MNNFEKITAVKDSEGFAQELETVESPEALQDLFHKHGVDLTMDEICDMAEKAVARKENELSENDLEDVAGGGAFSDWLVDTVAKWFVKKGLDWIYSKVTKKK